MSELNMTNFSNAYQLHTLFSTKLPDDIDYELWKMGQEVFVVSSEELFWNLHEGADKKP